MTISDITTDSNGMNRSGGKERKRIAFTSGIGSAIVNTVNVKNMKDGGGDRGSALTKDSGADQSVDSTVRSIRASALTKVEARESVVEGTKIPMKMKEMTELVRNMLREDDGLVEVTAPQIERIRKTYCGFSEGAEFSFNYNALLMVASILAGLGLAQGSVTTIIASMLVSPIMGPVMGMAYGSYIHDYKLKKKAFISEVISLLVCVFFGVIIGACTGWTDLADEWPNNEMLTRGTWQNLLVGLPIAFFSGLGVAVSLLDEQTSSLVGVAISASLLPPAVNSGLLFIAWFFYKQNVDKGEVVRTPDGDYEVWDATEDELNWVRKEFMHGAGISLLLTVVNIILIIIASALMFRLKERLPIRKKIYWMDLAAARAINKNLAMQFDDDEFDASEVNNAIHAVAASPVASGISEDHNNGLHSPSMAAVMEEADESTGHFDESSP